MFYVPSYRGKNIGIHGVLRGTTMSKKKEHIMGEDFLYLAYIAIMVTSLSFLAMNMMH